MPDVKAILVRDWHLPQSLAIRLLDKHQNDFDAATLDLLADKQFSNAYKLRVIKSLVAILNLANF